MVIQWFQNLLFITVVGNAERSEYWIEASVAVSGKMDAGISWTQGDQPWSTVEVRGRRPLACQHFRLVHYEVESTLYGADSREYSVPRSPDVCLMYVFPYRGDAAVGLDLRRMISQALYENSGYSPTLFQGRLNEFVQRVRTGQSLPDTNQVLGLLATFHNTRPQRRADRMGALQSYLHWRLTRN